MSSAGFSLVQLLLGLALASLLWQLGAPPLQALLASQRRQVLALELASGLRTARAEAVLQQRDVWVQSIDDDWRNGWRMQWVVELADDTDPDGPVVFERRTSGAVRVVGNSRVRTRLRFTAQGWPSAATGGVGNGTLHVCDDSAPVSHWRVIIATSGRTRVASGAQDEPLCRMEG
jgi:type IV fimbrial biogenesis protein FimT